MKIFLTGVTGLVGRSLALRLARDGHEVTGWVRDVDAAQAVLGDAVTRAENLGVMTPPTLAFELETPRPIEMHEGRLIDYQIRLAGVPMRWRTGIEAWEPHRRFVDVQLRGPYRTWVHEHRFEADGNRTRMIDRVWYAPPLGVLGRVAQSLFVGPMLRRISGHRRTAIDLRFGLVEPESDG